MLSLHLAQGHGIQRKEYATNLEDKVTFASLEKQPEDRYVAFVCSFAHPPPPFSMQI
jgi:hypothetical protein